MKFVVIVEKFKTEIAAFTFIGTEALAVKAAKTKYGSDAVVTAYATK